MILLVYLFLVTALLTGVAFVLTDRGLRGAWEKKGPFHVASSARTRNRLVLVVVAVVVALSALMEWLIADYHEAVLDAQYGVGDPFGWSPALVQEASMGGVSWGLYAALLLGVAAGLVLGSWLAANRYAIMRGTSVRAYL